MKELQIADVQVFAARYKKGNRIFKGVLRRQFKESADYAAEYLLKTGLAKEMTLLRCPDCMHEVALVDKLKRLKGDSYTVCPHCDKEWRNDRLIPDFVLIKN